MTWHSEWLRNPASTWLRDVMKIRKGFQMVSACFNNPFGGAGFRNHPQYDATIFWTKKLEVWHGLTWLNHHEWSFLQAVKITNARRTIGPIGMVYIYDYMIFNVYIYIHSNYIYTHSSKIICRYRVIYIILYIYVVDQTGCESVKSAKQSWHLMTIQLGRSAYDQPFLPVNSLNRSHCHTFIHIQSIAD